MTPSSRSARGWEVASSRAGLNDGAQSTSISTRETGARASDATTSTWSTPNRAGRVVSNRPSGSSPTAAPPTNTVRAPLPSVTEPRTTMPVGLSSSSPGRGASTSSTGLPSSTCKRTVSQSAGAPTTHPVSVTAPSLVSIRLVVAPGAGGAGVAALAGSTVHSMSSRSSVAPVAEVTAALASTVWPVT